MFSTLVGEKKGWIVRVEVHWFSIIEDVFVSSLCASLIAVLVKNWRWFLRFVGQLKIPLLLLLYFSFLSPDSQPHSVGEQWSASSSSLSSVWWRLSQWRSLLGWWRKHGHLWDQPVCIRHLQCFPGALPFCYFCHQSSAWVELVWQSFDLICMLS